MKKVFLVLSLAAIAILNNSCSKDDDPGLGDIPTEFIGTWSSIVLDSKECSDENDNGTCTVGCLTLEFTAEGTYTGTLYNEPIAGTVTGNESILRLCDAEGDCTDVSYTKGNNGTQISWMDEDSGCKFSGTIISPTFSTELVGTWVSDNATASGCSDVTDNGTCTSSCLSYTFQSNGYFKGSILNEAEKTGFGYASGSTLYLCWAGDLSCQTVTLDINNESGSVSWKDDDDGCDYTAFITKQ